MKKQTHEPKQHGHTEHEHDEHDSHGILGKIQNSEWYQNLVHSDNWRKFLSVMAVFNLWLPIQAGLLYWSTNESFGNGLIITMLFYVLVWLTKTLGNRAKVSTNFPMGVYVLIIVIIGWVGGMIWSGIDNLIFPGFSERQLHTVQLLSTVTLIVAHLCWFWAVRNWEEFLFFIHWSRIRAFFDSLPLKYAEMRDPKPKRKPAQRKSTKRTKAAKGKVTKSKKKP